MTAKDLAEKLLQYPDLEVYIYGRDERLYSVDTIELKPGNVAIEGGITWENNVQQEIIVLY